MRCRQCGNEIEKDDRFCSECGSVNPDYYVSRENKNRNKNKNKSDLPGNGTGNDDNTKRYSYDFKYGPYSSKYSDDKSSGQTISPYADDQTSDKTDAKKQNIPPVYSSDKNTAVGFSNKGTSSSGKKTSSRRRKHIPSGWTDNYHTERDSGRNNANKNTGKGSGKKNAARSNNAKDKGKKKSFSPGLIMLGLSAIIGVSCFAVYKNNESKKNEFPYKALRPAVHKEYDFNSMNVLKNPETIWETDNVKISTRSLDHESSFYSSAELKLQLENKTNETIKIYAKKVLINSCDLACILYAELDPGNIDTDEIYIDLDKMDMMKIENINTIDIWFEVQTSDHETIEESDRITVETQNTTVDEIYTGKLLYDEDGIKIGYYGKEYPSTLHNHVDFKLYYENDKDLNVDFKLSNVKVNGKDINEDEGDELYPHSRGVYDFQITEDQIKNVLKINKSDVIKDLDNILFTVNGKEHGTYSETIFTAPDLYTETPDK